MVVVVAGQDTIEPVVTFTTSIIAAIADLLQPPQGRPRRPSAPRHLHRAGPVEALPHPDQPGVQ